jgi:hypothetical protein
MKSFIIALILLFSVTLFVSINAVITVRSIDELLLLTDTLPQNEDAFANDPEKTAETVQQLTSLWDEIFPRITLTVGYENTNRCDEAISALAMHFENQNGEDFTVALSAFRDGLARLRILEGFHIEGIW